MITWRSQVRWILVLPVHTGFYVNFEFLQNVLEGHAYWHDMATNSSCGSVFVCECARALPVCCFIFPTADVTDIAQRYKFCFLHLPVWAVDKDITLMRKYCSSIFGFISNSHFQVIFITWVSIKFFSVFPSLGWCDTDEANNHILGRGTGTSAWSLRNETGRKYKLFWNSKISFLWDMTPPNLVEVLRKFLSILLLPVSLGCMRFGVNVLPA